MQNYIKTNILSLGQHSVLVLDDVSFCSGGGKCQEFKLRKLREKRNSGALSSHSVQPFMLHSLAVYFQIQHLACVVVIQVSYLIKTLYFLSYCSAMSHQSGVITKSVSAPSINTET